MMRPERKKVKEKRRKEEGESVGVCVKERERYK